MKGLLHKLLVCFFAATIFVSGNGVVLAIHTCLSNLHQDVSFFQEAECCSEKQDHCNPATHNPNSKIEAKCCTSEFKYEKISEPFLIQKNVEIAVLNVISPAAFSDFYYEQNPRHLNSNIPFSPNLDLPLLYSQLII